MKKYVIILLSALFIIMSLSACGTNQPDVLDGKFVATAYPSDFSNLKSIVFFEDGKCYIVFSTTILVDEYSYSSSTHYVGIGVADNPAHIEEILTLSNDGKTLSSESFTFERE